MSETRPVTRWLPSVLSLVMVFGLGVRAEAAKIVIANLRDGTLPLLQGDETISGLHPLTLPDHERLPTRQQTLRRLSRDLCRFFAQGGMLVVTQGVNAVRGEIFQHFEVSNHSTMGQRKV